MRSHVWMGIGLIAGLLLGLSAAALSANNQPGLTAVLVAIRPVGLIFQNLLSMVAIPLVATALFAGLAKLGELRMLGRLVGLTLGGFWVASVIAIALGFVIGSVMLPESAVSPEKQAILQSAAADPAAIARATQNLPSGLQFVLQLVPANPFKAAADGNLLPVIAFVTIFAIRDRHAAPGAARAARGHGRRRHGCLDSHRAVDPRDRAGRHLCTRRAHRRPVRLGGRTRDCSGSLPPSFSACCSCTRSSTSRPLRSSHMSQRGGSCAPPALHAMGFLGDVVDGGAAEHGGRRG